MFKVTFHAAPQEFEDLVQPFLLQREAENNLVLGLLPALARGAYGEFWMAAVQ